MESELNSFEFEHNGHKYRAAIYNDSDHGAPWVECDGHGPVTDWESRSKLPGELVLNDDHGGKRFYDFQEACKIARRDGWGWLPEPVRVERPGGYRLPTYRCGDFKVISDCPNLARSELYRQHRESMTPHEYAAGAARADYERLRAWCDGGWQYVGVVLQVQCKHCDEWRDTGGSLWGIESDCDEYLQDVARELAEESE